MPASVLDHVAQRISHLSGIAQDLHVITVKEHRALAAQLTVDAVGDAQLEPLDALGQRLVGLGLADKMYVVALDRELTDAKPRLVHDGEHGGPDDLTALAIAQPRHIVPDARGYVHGEPTREPGPSPMSHPPRT